MIEMKQVNKEGKKQGGRNGLGVTTNGSGEAGIKVNGRERQVGNSEVVVTSKRRRFSQAYKRQVLAEAKACGHGEVGAMLRREGLYSSHLATWRREMAAGKVVASKEKRKATKKRLEEMEKENARLQKELRKAQAIITAQKKLGDLINMMSESE
jgi:transposase-like protein